VTDCSGRDSSRAWGVVGLSSVPAFCVSIVAVPFDARVRND
jgi:hypothetical protein